MAAPALARALLDALPQTQCRRCGYADCQGYAEAIAEGSAELNRCPPGGQEGIARLARISGQPPMPLDTTCGEEGPRALAVIDESWCIGCALCLVACPVDAIVGAAKQMHTVIDDLCTGCELCIPVCPVDCITLVGASGERTGWNAWGAGQARLARDRYAEHRVRTAVAPGIKEEGAGANVAAPKHDTIAAALVRARSARVVR
ncbi:MAG: RnfABCDGE type electron transport complex subunit B [Caldimonas sp.]